MMACEVCHQVYVPLKNKADTDVKPHLCDTCGHSFSLKIQLKRHGLLHADGVPYTCVNCAKKNDYKGKTYNLRLGNKNEYICDICQKIFNNKRMLLRHSIQHTFDKTSDTEECDREKVVSKKNLCKRKYTRKSLDKKDNKTLDKKDFMACETCKKTFQSHLSLEKHTCKITKTTRILVCKICNRNFAYQACLNKHIKKGNCNITPDLNTILKLPINKTIKQDVKKHICNICGKTFARKSSLEGHELVHIMDKVTSEEEKDFSEDDYYAINNDENASERKKFKTTFNFQKSYTCDKCNFVCFSKLTLSKHSANHQDKHFEEERSLNISLEKHNEIKAVNRELHECKKCGKKLKSEEKLHKHNLAHLKKKKIESNNESEDLQCRICDESFVFKGDFEHHDCTQLDQTQNENIKSYECEVCDKIFPSRSILDKHLFTHLSESKKSADISKWHKKRRQRSKNYICAICGRRFAGEICLKKHTLKHELAKECPKIKRSIKKCSEEKKSANECSEGETLAKELQDVHMLAKECQEENKLVKECQDKNVSAKESTVKVKKIKPVKELICKYCEEEFTGRRAAYIKHIHAHTPEVCGICDERFVDRLSLREHCKIHVGTEEGRMFMQCSQKALDAKNGIVQPEPKVEYIYLVLR